MLEKIYIVGGMYSEYDSNADWVVCSYKNMKSAQEHTDAANQWVKNYRDMGLKGEINPYDRNGEYGDYERISYYCHAVELKDEFNEDDFIEDYYSYAYHHG